MLAYLAALPYRSTEVAVYTSPRRSAPRQAGVTVSTFEGINRSHWWLVARRDDAIDQ